MRISWLFSDLQCSGVSGLRSLSLHTGVAGLYWDPMKLRYRDTMALAVWGNTTDLQQAVGRLIPVSARM